MISPAADLEHSFLVILPAIAQRLVDDANIPIHSAEIIRPTPDSITFSLAASLKVPLGLSVTVDKFDLELFDREKKPRTPYVTVPLGPVTLKGNSALNISNQTTTIQNEDEFTKFLAKAVYSKNFTLSAYGKTTAHLGKLKVPLTLNKDIELAGMFLPRPLLVQCIDSLYNRTPRVGRIFDRFSQLSASSKGRRLESGGRSHSSQPFFGDVRPGKSITSESCSISANPP